MAEKPQLRISIEAAERAITHFLTKGNGFNFAKSSGPQFSEVETQFERWSQDVSEFLKELFTTAEIAERFMTARVDPNSTSGTDDETRRSLAFYGTLRQRMDFLERLRETLPIFTVAIESKPDAIQILQRICMRFNTVAHQLRQRHGDRPTLDIKDEYDVQDLLHALLRIFFDDVREEEGTTSFAGGASRIDFLLKTEQILVETKMARESLKAKQLSDELIVDKERYRIHPDCKLLYCFVYDPNRYIKNPQGIENDLNSSDSPFPVRVFIAPKN